MQDQRPLSTIGLELQVGLCAKIVHQFATSHTSSNDDTAMFSQYCRPPLSIRHDLDQISLPFVAAVDVLLTLTMLTQVTTPLCRHVSTSMLIHNSPGFKYNVFFRHHEIFMHYIDMQINLCKQFINIFIVISQCHAMHAVSPL